MSRTRGYWGVVGVLALATCGLRPNYTLGPQPGYPQITAGKVAPYHGDYTDWTFDEGGSYRWASQSSPDGNSSRHRKCGGSVPADRIRPIFAELEELDLTEIREDYEAMVEQERGELPERTGPFLRYRPSEGIEMFPANGASLERWEALRERARGLMPEPSRLRCKSWTSG